MRSQEHQKIMKTATKKITKYRSSDGPHGSKKGNDKGLTEDDAVLPESIKPRQSETSLRRSVK
jgi:hypothetical protein